MINLEKKKMMQLLNKEYGSYFNRIICKKSSNINTPMIKIIVKLKVI